MQLRKLFYLMLILPVLFLGTACSDDDEGNPVDNNKVNEAEVLAKYYEANGDFINTAAPAMISAEGLKAVVGTEEVFIMDIRGAADYAKGHIEGAVNVAANDVVNYYETNNLAEYQTVVVACYSGQTAAWATALLQLKGYSNVKDLAYGCSSWNSELAKSWTNSVGNNVTNLETSGNAKNTAGELPALKTGKTEGADIAAARIDAVLAEGFGEAKITVAEVMAAPENYYIVNYWGADHYNLGHIPGAIQYTPKAAFKLDADIKTLPTEKTIVVYCYTGQTSAHVAAFLRTLGYDAKSLLFGINTINYDFAKENGLTIWTDAKCMEYPYVAGE